MLCKDLKHAFHEIFSFDFLMDCQRVWNPSKMAALHSNHMPEIMADSCSCNAQRLRNLAGGQMGILINPFSIYVGQSFVIRPSRA
jgi:hypothetical protein